MKLFDLQHISDTRGTLDVLEKDLNFPVERVFIINAPAGAERGGHGHKKCQMILICPHGAVEVIVNDGSGRKSILLDRSSKGVFLEPADWHVMNFLEDSVLVVQASEKYDEGDYIYNEPKI